MSGLGAAVIPYSAPQTDLDKYINNLNGILFTGGSLSLLPNTTYYKTAKYLYEGVIASNQRNILHSKYLDVYICCEYCVIY